MRKTFGIPSIAIAALLVIGLAPQARGSFRIEAETATGWGNIGGQDLAISYCSHASMDSAVTGMDRPGDWISIPVTLPESTCISDSLRDRGQDNLVRRFAVYWIPDPPATTSSADTAASPPGQGFA